MSIDQDPNLVEEDDYDEEADSDFAGDDAPDQDLSSSSDEDVPVAPNKSASKPRTHNQSTSTKPQRPDSPSIDLDSGDEATIKEQRKSRRKQKRKGEQVDLESDSGDGNDKGWRARTRAMREREKDEKKLNKLANLRGSTIDVEKIWADMNRPGPLPVVRAVVSDGEGREGVMEEATKEDVAMTEERDGNKENVTPLATEEMITIKRQYKFAGEVHFEEKVVPKSSAEARLWLSQQDPNNQPPTEESDSVKMQRPLRKISRFDPNAHNLAAFKMNLPRTIADTQFKGPKLNVVEKSKMDWASHVDAEGLKDELDEHAKAKEGYHSRMEFLSGVEARREEEARIARTKK